MATRIDGPEAIANACTLEESMSIEMKDMSGRPWPLRDLEAALAFVEAEMVVNPARMGPKETGPATIHYIVIRDALRALIALAR